MSRCRNKDGAQAPNPTTMDAITTDNNAIGLVGTILIVVLVLILLGIIGINFY